MVNLGKKTLWWRVRVVLLSPFWLSSGVTNKKSWIEFKNGLIIHTCEFDKLKPNYSQAHHRIIIYPCKHTGCNTVDILDVDMELLRMKKKYPEAFKDFKFTEYIRNEKEGKPNE